MYVDANELQNLLYTVIFIVSLVSANRPHPSSTTPPFSKDDPRLKYVLSKLDPRVHFALVCGAKVR